LLAASPDGCTEALMFANGFTAELLVELVLAGLASAHLSKTHSIVAKPAKQFFFGSVM
jgi:hypothetical protein